MKLPTDLDTLKPKLIQWMETAWQKLQASNVKQMIKQGWDSLGFYDALNQQFQLSAAIEDGAATLDESKLGEEEETESTAVCEEMDDEKDAADGDEDTDVASSIADCLEKVKQTKTGIRSSSRLQQSSSRNTDKRLAQLITEDQLNSACYFDDCQTD